ncbi:glycosyltransferase family 4 protein [Ancylobacter pratisalsi]|uniref:Glycosyltransferase family 4 protein n=1 Tax=Ancylobacter pratisalsi TaxID=1745854 RepID=A0A6P1YGM8_9HYPH|nr:glycosyltransferase family 4 protein [Ancylobacter pratisalsi]QIB32439.1 glycosyltransferase family 4 protein [Ancylobacter pratisalsi]
MTNFAFAIPGDLGLATGGYAYDRRVITECRNAGWDVTHLALPGGFPFPSPEELAQSRKLLHALPEGQAVLVDGLALGVLPATMLRALRRPLAALVHHPLALETGLDDALRSQLVASERAALAEASIVIATSPATARLLEQDFGVARSKLVVALPGTDPASRAHGGGTSARLLSVGAVIPRKAYGVLVEALARLTTRDWTCHIVGATDRDRQETRALEQRIAARGLTDRISLTGALPAHALVEEFAAADLFVSASLFEGYGMGLTEALACGLPIVATDTGAIPDTVPRGASLLVPANDAANLAEAIGLLLDEPDRRRRMADEAWRHAQALPRWSQTADAIMTALKEMPR